MSGGVYQMEEKEKIGAAVAAEKSDDGVQKEQTVLSVEKTEIPVADSKNQKDANDESGKSKSAEEKNVKKINQNLSGVQ